MSEHMTSQLGTRWHDRHPVAVAVGIALMGYLILSAILVGIGLSLTNGLLSGPLGRWDESVNDWFLAHRTPPLNSWSHVGSLIAMTGTVIGIATIVVIALMIRKHRREAGFLIIGLAVEVTVFLTTTLLVDRSRPTVPRLEPSPPTSSFPSGHTAASVALYVGMACLLSPRVHRASFKALLWIVASAIPLAVAVARVYAGMHHTTDVVAGALLGLGALWVASLAVRTATVAAAARATEHSRDTRPPDLAAERPLTSDVSP